RRSPTPPPTRRRSPTPPPTRRRSPTPPPTRRRSPKHRPTPRRVPPPRPTRRRRPKRPLTRPPRRAPTRRPARSPAHRPTPPHHPPTPPPPHVAFPRHAHGDQHPADRPHQHRLRQRPAGEHGQHHRVVGHRRLAGRGGRQRHHLRQHGAEPQHRQLRREPRV